MWTEILVSVLVLLLNLLSLTLTLPTKSDIIQIISSTNESLSIVNLTELPPPTNWSCEPEWHHFVPGSKCVKYHQDMVGANLHDAIAICEHSYRAKLITIHSQEETEFLNSIVFESFGSKYSAWIGLIRVGKEKFVWLDRSPLNYTNWAPKEPNNWNSKNYCVVISSEPDVLGKWYDVGCTSTYMVICEKNATFVGERNPAEISKKLKLQQEVEEVEEEEISKSSQFDSKLMSLIQPQSQLEQLTGNLSTIRTNIGSIRFMADINFILIMLTIVTLSTISVCRSYRISRNKRTTFVNSAERLRENFDTESTTSSSSTTTAKTTTTILQRFSSYLNINCLRSFGKNVPKSYWFGIGRGCGGGGGDGGATTRWTRQQESQLVSSISNNELITSI